MNFVLPNNPAFNYVLMEQGPSFIGESDSQVYQNELTHLYLTEVHLGMLFHEFLKHFLFL